MVDSLKQSLDSGEFKDFVYGIRFPHFKNLVENLSIDFDYPVTFLTGPNGTNKSSILRALQCTCSGNVLESHWFATELDEIKPNQSYIFKYKTPSGLEVESLQVYKGNSSKKDRSLDYWESDKPRKKYNMKLMHEYGEIPDSDQEYVSDRWKKLNRDVIYLDFRSELPAFDILMNFNWHSGSKKDLKSKKRFIRQRSRALEEIFDEFDKNQSEVNNNKIISSKKIKEVERVLEGVVEMPQVGVDAVSRILDREYNKIKLVKHDLFDAEGYTAQLFHGDSKYSEAFAGSGEFAAIMLIFAISKAEEGSLVLLDEPETSLHPGAQKELIKYIQEKSMEKKLQFVIATHSPSLIEGFPDCSIKVFQYEKEINRVILPAQENHYSEAFIRMGATFKSEKLTIIVEDALAHSFIKAAICRLPEHQQNSIVIQPVPGGADSIRNYISLLSFSNTKNIHIYLDGDQRPQEKFTSHDLDKISISDVDKNFEFTRVSIKSIPRNSGTTNTETVDLKKNVIRWFKDNVSFLPTSKDPDTLLAVLDMGEDEDFLESLYDSKFGKNYWCEKSKQEYEGIVDNIDAKLIYSLQVRALNKQINSCDQFASKIFDEIKTNIIRILNSRGVK